MTYHSVWLMPSGKINDELSKMITQISHSFTTPVFPPHLTLMGELTGSEKELCVQTQRLAARMEPLQINLTAVDYLDEYFRCLFLRAEETDALQEANRQARKLFQREQDLPFMPHLSLMYGNFDRETKTQIIESIGREFNQSFSVSQIHLFSTTGEPMDWYRVQKFELQGR